MSVRCKCCMFSGRGLCYGLITRPEESYRMWCVVVCDLETSWMMRPWPTGGGGGCCAKRKTKENSRLWDLGWIKWHSDRFFSGSFTFALPGPPVSRIHIAFIYGRRYISVAVDNVIK
jgi:hypothetical protein